MHSSPSPPRSPNGTAANPPGPFDARFPELADRAPTPHIFAAPCPGSGIPAIRCVRPGCGRTFSDRIHIAYTPGAA